MGSQSEEPSQAGQHRHGAGFVREPSLLKLTYFRRQKSRSRIIGADRGHYSGPGRANMLGDAHVHIAVASSVVPEYQGRILEKRPKVECQHQEQTKNHANMRDDRIPSRARKRNRTKQMRREMSVADCSDDPERDE